MTERSDEERMAAARAEARAFLSSTAAMAAVEERDPELFGRMLRAAAAVLDQESREADVAASLRSGGNWMRSPLDFWVTVTEPEVHLAPYERAGPGPLEGMDVAHLVDPERPAE